MFGNLQNLCCKGNVKFDDIYDVFKYLKIAKNALNFHEIYYYIISKL